MFAAGDVRQGTPILALDAPSGVDTTTGTVFTPAIQATATMTLALPKEGLRAPDAEKHVGELYLADISVPPALYAEPALGIQVGAVFAKDDILRLRERYLAHTGDVQTLKAMRERQAQACWC